MPRPTDLRVFISSTFRDLQEEREHLIKRVFPEIRALCRERGVTFTEVDLRWGLTEEDLVLGQVIRACLEEVDKCRPYFIGITGDRYGYVPTYLDIQKDPSLLAHYPWIEDAAIDGMSITEMEAQYAVLSAPETARSGALFYFRRHRAGLELQGDDERERLEAYQGRIRGSGATVGEFRDPVSLGEMIYDDLVTIINRDFADVRPATPLEQERTRHDAFAQSRRRAYIANPLYLRRLNDHVASDDPPLVVYAASGSGKSSLFAYWAEQVRRRQPEVLVIEHYVGIGAVASDRWAIIQHLCMEIKERFAREEELPATPQELERALGQWLGYADHELTRRGERMVVILDGLNQLQGSAASLRWIPESISPRIRLVVGSTAVDTLTEMNRRGWGQFGMQALSEAEAEALVVRYLAEYGKALSPEQIRRIAADGKCGHPLFLKTLLEEIRLVGRHEELAERVDGYLRSTSTEDLFQRVLERLEDDYSQKMVREVMSLLWCSRSGLSETELSELTGIGRLRLSTLLIGLDYHLVRRDGTLTFFHDYLRRAVEMRYLSEEPTRQERFRQSAAHFERAPVTMRSTRELVHALVSAGNRKQLADTLATIERFMVLNEGEARFELLGHWSELAGEFDIVESTQAGLQRYRDAHGTVPPMVLERVSKLLEDVGRWKEAEALQRERLSMATAEADQAAEASSRAALGRLLRMQGDHDGAFEELTRARELFDAVGDRAGLSYVVGSLGIMHYLRAEYERALACYDEQERTSRELADLRGLSNAFGCMGLVHAALGASDRALECFIEYERICRERGDRRQLATAIGNMGFVFFDRGEYDRVLECYGEQERICRELGDRSGVFGAVGNMGFVFTERGDYARALECFREASDGHRDIGYRFGVAHWLEGSARALLAVAGDRGAMPDFLAELLTDATEQTWQRSTLEAARERAEASLAIARELSTPVGMFNAEVLLARIEHARGDASAARALLGGLLAVAADDGQRAELRYWLWKIGPDRDVTDGASDDHRAEALRLYRAFDDASPKNGYRARIEELTAGVIAA
ncbi:MAG TPA: DUF4062 domain-containing protein [Candidatus Kapabacteria bacterium]|nr:DUF4062 domain-containing protein [Candidatus Kapabacteria bacterium]